MLNTQEKKLISNEIEKLELESSTELVAVITKRSGSYRYIMSIISLLVTIFISVILVFTTNISKFDLLQIQMLILVGFHLFFTKFDDLLLLIIPKSYKQSIAKENAQKQFYNLGLNRTKTKQAIMFFVSLDEKYVEIIADEVVSKKINNHFWQDIIDEFVEDVKKEQISRGYLKAIKSCSKILIQYFPIKKDDENELPNEVVELKH